MSNMSPLGLIGYGVENGDLRKGIGGGFPTLPVHAYIPMRRLGKTGAMVFVEGDDPANPADHGPVAYRNQMRAKRIADSARRKHRKSKKWNAKVDSFHVIGITVK